MKGFQKTFNLYTGTIFIVILSYAFLACSGLNKGSFSTVPLSHYQYLTESFSQGKTYLNIEVPAALLALTDTFDYEKNKNIFFKDGESLHKKLHDASVYEGKFYLYFGPLPVLSLYLPWKLLTGWYLPDYMGVFVFLSVGFLFCFRLLIQIKNTYFKHVSESEVCFMGLLLGFANNAPFLLVRPIFYEAAIASAFCFVSISLFFMFRLFEKNFRLVDIFLFSTCLTLSAAGRPHFALLAIFILPIFFIYFCRVIRQHIFLRSGALIFPALLIGSLLLFYNEVRFHSPFEFGQHYQLFSYRYGINGDMFALKDLGFNLIMGFYHYFLRPFVTLNSFPYVFFPDLFMEHVQYHHIYEGTFGLLKTAPFIIFIVLLPFEYEFYMKHDKHVNLLKFILCFSMITGIILLFLFSLMMASQRYLSDFSTFVIMLAVLSFWLSKGYLSDNIFKIGRLFFMMTGLLGIYIGIIQSKSILLTMMYFRDANFVSTNNLIFVGALLVATLFLYKVLKR